VSILHFKLFENYGDERLLAKTDASTIFFAVDFYAEELIYQAKIGNLVFFCKPGIYFYHIIGSVFWVQH
jgi:hypothetical protein